MDDPRLLRVLAVGITLATSLASAVEAQSPAERRWAIWQAEERGASSPKDLATITSGLRSDPETARMAVRALGRLERPSLLSQIVPSLRSPSPEVRAEAAHAVAQAAQGFKQPKVSASTTIGATQATLLGRLDVEAEPTVRAALCEALARLPYRAEADVDRAEKAILASGSRSNAVTDRLGVAKALEALVRLHRSLRRPGDAAIAELRTLVFEPATGVELDPLRDARVRRLALEGLIAAGAIDEDVVGRALKDPDAQVRRLAVRAAVATGHGSGTVDVALLDPVAMVRIEALHVVLARPTDAACATALGAASDSTEVAVVALDRLGSCGSEPAITLLERTVMDPSRMIGPRSWPRAGHALVSLASAAPERAAAALPMFTAADRWQLRFYAARAASVLKDRATLDALAKDANPAVAAEARGVNGAQLDRSHAHDDVSLPDAQALSVDPRRMAGLRARVTVRGLGRFDLALITTEAPASALRFVQQASAGLYAGRTLRVGADTLLVGSPSDTPSAPPLAARPEVGSWPHVRGTVGVSLSDRGEGEALFFINQVDNPRFDHEQTVFAQVLNGIEVIDQIVDGDVIESVDILP